MNNDKDFKLKIDQVAGSLITTAFRQMTRQLDQKIEKILHDPRGLPILPAPQSIKKINEIENLCVEDLINRADRAWEAFQKVISKYGIEKVSAGKVKTDINNRLTDSICELNGRIAAAGERIHFTRMPNVEKGLKEAIQRVNTEIDLYFDIGQQLTSQKTNGISAMKDPVPNFHSLSSNSRLVEILTERWNEAQKCVAEELYVAAIIMIGSLLEGVLYAKIKSNWASAKQSSRAPTDSKRSVKKLSRWKLSEMIDVAHDCQWIQKHAVDFSGTLHILRDYRNIVHPRKQLKSGITPDVDTCAMAWPVVRAAINDLIRSCSVP